MSIPVRGDWQLLRRYLQPQRRAALLMGALLLAGIALQLAGPWVARGFINAVMARAAVAALVRQALVFIGLSAAAQAMQVLAVYWSERVAWTAANALRLDLTAHLLRLDLSFHKEHQPGELMERVDGDVNALAGFFSGFVVKLVGSLLLLVGILVLIFPINLWLGVAFTAFALLTGALLNRVRTLAVPWHREDRERSAGFYGCVGEVITAAEDIRANGAVPHALQRINAHLTGWAPVVVRAQVLGSAVWMTAVAAFAAGDAIAYGFGGWLYRLQTIPLGTVYLVVACAGLLEQPIELLRTQLEALQQAQAAVARVRELLRLRPRLTGGDHLVPAGPLAVELDRVHFRYDDSQSEGVGAEYVLAGISLQLAPGRVLGLLGRTGSGKTTIARLLTRLYDPQQGAVCLGGVDLREAGLQSVRARVGLVTQDVQIFHASLRDNLTLFNPDVADGRLLEVIGHLGLIPWLERLPRGLDTPVSPASLSAGEAQLLAFARVFLKDPGLVILDEASSRLDPATEALLDGAVRRLLAGRTAIIIAHRLATLEQVDEVMLLDGGRVAEHGLRAELAADPDSQYYRLRRAGPGEVLR